MLIEGLSSDSTSEIYGRALCPGASGGGLDESARAWVASHRGQAVHQ